MSCTQVFPNSRISNLINLYNLVPTSRYYLQYLCYFIFLKQAMSTRSTISTITKRSANSMQKRSRPKQECRLGSKCPYQNEYQHDLEFSHTCEGKLSTSSNSNFQPFQGKAYKLSTTITAIRTSKTQTPSKCAKVAKKDVPVMNNSFEAKSSLTRLDHTNQSFPSNLPTKRYAEQEMNESVSDLHNRHHKINYEQNKIASETRDLGEIFSSSKDDENLNYAIQLSLLDAEIIPQGTDKKSKLSKRCGDSNSIIFID